MDNQEGNTSNSLKPAKRQVSLKTIVVLVVAVGFLAGLAYTNFAFFQTQSKVDDIESRMTKLDGLSGQFDQIINTGANDKILGYDKVTKDGIQAAFLSNGQVYFGKITDITTKNVILENVYYLKDGGSSLVKLGCETHKPEDKMTIVRSNLQFWENLKADDEQGVSSAIKQYEAANPDGQKCP